MPIQSFRVKTPAYKFQLSAVNAVSFAISIILGVLTIFQVLRCIRVLRSKPDAHRISYTILLFAILLTLANHILSAVEISQDYQLAWSPPDGYVPRWTVDPQLTEAYYLGWDWVSYEAEILLALALFVHMRQRMIIAANPVGMINSTDAINLTTKGEASAPVPPVPIAPLKPFPAWKWLIDAGLLFVWQIFAIAEVAFWGGFVNGLGRLSLTVSEAKSVYNGLSYTRLAFLTVTTIVFAVTSRIIWYRMKTLLIYDKNVRYAAFISFLLIIRVKYQLFLTILKAQPLSATQTVNWDVLNLLSLLIEGSFFYGAIYMFLEGATRRMYERRARWR